jgi:hypothetical protein
VLLTQCTNGVVTTGTLSAEHLTADQCTTLLAGAGSSGVLTNSLLTAVTAVTNVTLYNSAQLSSGNGVYQTVGAASYYLADGSTNRNVGTTNILPALLSDLKKRTTYPPIFLTNNFTADTILSPQAQRDTDVPDRGYEYDPLDYVVGGITVTTNTLVLTNGVALGAYRKSSNPAYGIGIQSGRLVSAGLAQQLNYIVYYNTVQEQSNTNWSSTSVGQSICLLGVSGSAQCRFTGCSILGGSGDHFRSSANGVPTASLQNCQLSGGTFTADQLSAGLTNCLWERVVLYLSDDDYVAHWYLLNNLFRGGSFTCSINHSGDGTSGMAYDNLFDRTAISGGGATFTNGYNAYVTNCTRFSGTRGNDRILTNSPVYLTAYLGAYYYPTNDGILSMLIDAGSRWATNAGLYHFTTTTNQVKEGTTKVDIGFHYVAINPGTGQPYDTDGDGVPDYLEDVNGDGSATGDPTSWLIYDSANGLSAGTGLKVFTPLK